MYQLYLKNRHPTHTHTYTHVSSLRSDPLPSTNLLRFISITYPSPLFVHLYFHIGPSDPDPLPRFPMTGYQGSLWILYSTWLETLLSPAKPGYIQTPGLSPSQYELFYNHQILFPPIWKSPLHGIQIIALASWLVPLLSICPFLLSHPLSNVPHQSPLFFFHVTINYQCFLSAGHCTKCLKCTVSPNSHGVFRGFFQILKK